MRQILAIYGDVTIENVKDRDDRLQLFMGALVII